MMRVKGLARLTLAEPAISLIGNNSRVTHYPIGYIRNCIPAPHDPTWAEENGMPDYDDGPRNLKYGHISRNAMPDKWAKSVRAYIAGTMDKDELRTILHSKCFGVVCIKAT